MEDPKICAYRLSSVHEIEDVRFLGVHFLDRDYRLVVTAKNGDARILIFKAWRINDTYRVQEYTGRASGTYPHPEAAVKAGLSAARDFFE